MPWAGIPPTGCTTDAYHRFICACVCLLFELAQAGLIGDVCLHGRVGWDGCEGLRRRNKLISSFKRQGGVDRGREVRHRLLFGQRSSQHCMCRASEWRVGAHTYTFFCLVVVSSCVSVVTCESYGSFKWFHIA